jgi:antitoxin CptB
MSMAARIRRLAFRAWHRGTREADYILGGFFDAKHADWDAEDVAWFEALLEEDDSDVLAWVMGSAAVPERFAGPQMEAMRKLDYVRV